MLFQSPQFLVFFAGYFAAHVLISPAYRLWLIVLGGAIFYAYWDPVLIWLPFALAAMGWMGALWLSAADKDNRRARLAVALLALTAPLLTIKYADFILRQLLGASIGHPQLWALPLGISFVTFTVMAYVIDVYRGRYPVERRPHMVAAYVVFFPHLIAGPILRPRELMPQLDRWRPVWEPNFKFALVLFTVGLVKKTIFADQFATVVDRAYGSAAGLSALDYLLGIYAFSAQIYCDFSGYADMAIALALTLGIRLPKNFNRPYLALNVADFWRHWHITLSFWLRDYIYIPLGGNRGGRLGWLLNVMITMVIGGLWHGANWTFVLWGALHGLFVIASRAIYRGGRPGLRVRIISMLITFHIVTLLWILFRAPNIATAWRVLQGPFAAPTSDTAALLASNAYTVLLLGLFFLWHPFDSHGRLRLIARKVAPAILWPATVMIWVLVVSLGAGSPAKFIYFDF